MLAGIFVEVSRHTLQLPNKKAARQTGSMGKGKMGSGGSRGTTAERDRGSEGRVKGKSRACREENSTVLLPVQ